MIVFDLICPTGHRFESWFRDGAAFDEQTAEGAVVCPLCGDTRIVKAPTRLHIGRHGGDRQLPAGESLPATLTEAIGELRRRIEANCDYVGQAFAEEARRIHYGETESRSIYGEASREDAAALADEGIEVKPMPWFQRRDD